MVKSVDVFFFLMHDITTSVVQRDLYASWSATSYNSTWCREVEWKTFTKPIFSSLFLASATLVPCPIPGMLMGEFSAIPSVKAG